MHMQKYLKTKTKKLEYFLPKSVRKRIQKVSFIRVLKRNIKCRYFTQRVEMKSKTEVIIIILILSRPLKYMGLGLIDGWVENYKQTLFSCRPYWILYHFSYTDREATSS